MSVVGPGRGSPEGRASVSSDGRPCCLVDVLWVKSPLCKADRGRSIFKPSSNLAAASASWSCASNGIRSGVMSAAGSSVVDVGVPADGGLGLWVGDRV